MKRLRQPGSSDAGDDGGSPARGVACRRYAIGAAGIGIALAERVFKLENYWPPAAPLLTLIFAASALVAFAGWAGTLRIARTPPVTILRKA